MMAIRTRPITRFETLRPNIQAAPRDARPPSEGSAAGIESCSDSVTDARKAREVGCQLVILSLHYDALSPVVRVTFFNKAKSESRASFAPYRLRAYLNARRWLTKLFLGLRLRA